MLTRDGDGFRASGHKDFSTGASVADGIMIYVSLDGEPGGAIIPKGRAGVSFDRRIWNNLGQRLTESCRTILDNVRIEAEEIIGQIPAPRGSAFATLAIPLIQSVFSSFYLGGARGAVRDAAEYVRTTTRPWLHSGVKRATEDPYAVERLANSKFSCVRPKLYLIEQASNSRRLLIVVSG